MFSLSKDQAEIVQIEETITKNGERVNKIGDSMRALKLELSRWELRQENFFSKYMILI